MRSNKIERGIETVCSSCSRTIFYIEKKKKNKKRRAISSIVSVYANSPADISIRKCNCVANEAFKKGKEEGKRREESTQPNSERERINHASEQTAPFAPLKGLGKGEPHGCIDNDGTRQRYRYITLCRARTKGARKSVGGERGEEKRGEAEAEEARLPAVVAGGRIGPVG